MGHLQISARVGAAARWIDGAVWDGPALREPYACSNERMEGEEYRGGHEPEQEVWSSDSIGSGERKKKKSCSECVFTF